MGFGEIYIQKRGVVLRMTRRLLKRYNQFWLDEEDLSHDFFLWLLLTGENYRNKLAYVVIARLIVAKIRHETQRGKLKKTGLDVALDNLHFQCDRLALVDSSDYFGWMLNMVRSDEKKKILLLYYWKGFSIQEIADMLGKTNTSTKERLFSGRKDIEAKLGKKYKNRSGIEL